MALSPMMQHYVNMKEKYKDSVLLYRLGDFYEMFFEDAEICHRVLDLTLTGKDCGLPERAPMCGMPFHSCDPYIARLLQAGYKVAICEQLTEPTQGRKLVERDVVRVITPGTVIDSSLVDETRANYLASIYKQKGNIGLSYIDVSTGDFYTTEFTEGEVLSQLNDNLVRIKPSEVLCNAEMKEVYNELPCVIGQYIPPYTDYSEEAFDYIYSETRLKEQLGATTLKTYNCASKNYAICSCGALLSYIEETQKRTLSHINSITYVLSDDYMQIDSNTRRNLELTETNKDRKRHGSLLWLLDKTETKMGERVLSEFVSQPLFNEKKIVYRQKGVEELVKNIYARERIKEALHNIHDIERLCGKASYGNLSPKDCEALKNSLKMIPDIKSVLSRFEAPIIKTICSELYDFSDTVDLLEMAFIDGAPALLRAGGFIKRGFNAELDELDDVSSNGKKVIVELEAREKEVTGIKNLKIAFNKVFGYYIEVTNSQKNLVPYHYVRKQTTVNAERYITEELKDIEYKVLHAQELKLELEIKLFNEIRSKLLLRLSDMQTTARAIALLDALYSLSAVAVERNYVKPIIDKTGSVIEIIDGRHPVVEAINRKEEFVPNDTTLNTTDCRTMIITGPNMAGKSTYMRQVALITLMAHIGSFVPARSAKIALTDRIFTRVGASDDLAFGQSTFMVEMSEVSNILKNATNNSLIILDEVGRGTSTFDGLSIAWSVMEYVSKHLCAKTLFATHYHELTDLEGILEGVKNFKVSVKEYNNSVIFLRKIVRGGANRSFGIEVASLAGLPEEVLNRAREILKSLEESQANNNLTQLNESTSEQSQKKSIISSKVMQILSDLDINTLTPLNAFDVLVELKNQLKDK